MLQNSPGETATIPLAGAAAGAEAAVAAGQDKRLLGQANVEHPSEELEDTLMWLTKSGDGEVGAAIVLSGSCCLRVVKANKKV
jgi:hypothetical protein